MSASETTDVAVEGLDVVGGTGEGVGGTGEGVGGMSEGVGGTGGGVGGKSEGEGECKDEYIDVDAKRAAIGGRGDRSGGIVVTVSQLDVVEAADGGPDVSA